MFRFLENESEFWRGRKDNGKVKALESQIKNKNFFGVQSSKFENLQLCVSSSHFKKFRNTNVYKGKSNSFSSFSDYLTPGSLYPTNGFLMSVSSKQPSMRRITPTGFFYQWSSLWLSSCSYPPWEYSQVLLLTLCLVCRAPTWRTSSSNPVFSLQILLYS